MIVNSKKLYCPGIAFVMLKDGEAFFSKGYGYADLKNQIPIDPEQTILHIESTAKLFTVTVAMHQLTKTLKARKRLLSVLLLTLASWMCASHIQICRGMS